MERNTRSLILGAGAVLGLSVLLMQSSSWAAVVNVIDFKIVDGTSVTEIVADGPLTYQQQENAADSQFVLEMDQSKLQPLVARSLDTSSFNSPVKLISPYEIDGKVRLVFQLTQAQTPTVTQEGNKLKVVFSGGEALPAASGAPEQEALTQESVAPPQPSELAVSPVDAPAAGVEKKKDEIDQFFENRKTQNFKGKPITLEIKGAPIEDVLRLIGKASGFNIVVGADVKGSVTLSLKDVPWDQVLDVVLHTNRLGAERNYNVLRVVTLENLTKEKREQLEAERAAKATAPLVTRVFPINYADPKDLASLLGKYGMKSSGLTNGTAPGGGMPSAGGGQASSFEADNIQVDNRTNSIIVQDIQENLERIQKLIEILDTETPQVMVEAKVVEAEESFSNAISGSFGFGDGISASKYFASVAGANPVDALIGSPGAFADGSAAADKNPGARFGVSPKLSFLPGNFRLNAILSLSEQESKIKVVSSPKNVVLNKQSAKIIQSTPVAIPVVTATNPPTISYEVKDANLSLEVVPTVTNDERVIMDLKVANDTPQDAGNNQTAIGKREVNSKVIVKSGSTLVIGGIYTARTLESSSGLPWLRKIPIIGYLFGSESKTTRRTELFIFITPRILNVKEAGLQSSST